MLIKKPKQEEHAPNTQPGEVFAGQEKMPNQPELKEPAEKKEIIEDKSTREKIKEQIESIDLDDALTVQAQTHANDLKSQQAQVKIQSLLQIAQKKGVVFAVHVAKKMNDPYLLDMFHDALAQEGYYKKFLK